MEHDIGTQILLKLSEIQAALPERNGTRHLIIGGFIGLVAALVPSAVLEHLRNRREARALRASIVAEISALAEIIRTRRYLDALRAGACGHPDWGVLQVKMPEDCFLIYKSNAARIGLLKPKDAKHIVRFYQIADSLIQDVTPGGMLYDGSGGIEAFKAATLLLEQALVIADDLRTTR